MHIIWFYISLANTNPQPPLYSDMITSASPSDADVNNDPEYVRVYSLPLFFARLFRNCAYLEYTSRGKLPEPPAIGVYQASKGDVGELCCPCFFRTESASSDDSGDMNKDKGTISSPSSNVINRSYESMNDESLSVQDDMA